jgi:hypothetical protein
LRFAARRAAVWAGHAHGLECLLAFIYRGPAARGVGGRLHGVV